MQCHKCPHKESIERGDYISKPWKNTPCAKCRLGEDTFYSVPFDEEQLDGTTGSSPAMSSFTEGLAVGTSSRTSVDMVPVSVLSQFIQGFLSLDPVLRDIVVWRYQGLTYKEIAAQQDTSVQLAEMRHKRALRDWPVLKALFPAKVAKQSRRKASR